MEKHPLHLKNPELQTSPEVEEAVEKQERLTGEKLPNDPTERIGAYMDRLENIFLNPNERVRTRNLEMLKDKIYDKLIIKRENFPDSYFELQKRVARERGQAVEEIPEDVRERMMDVVIEDQKASLDAIIDYLSSNDATYPAWFKYYAWTQLTKLSQFDKERGEFKTRTKNTVAPFPALHYGPLAAIADLYERVKDDNKDSEARQAFDKKFPSLYAELTAKSLAETVENREEIRGKWVKYNQGDTTAAETLFQSLKGRGTGWCTADGRTTAATQIESGDFYVYYTNDKDGIPTQPRLAIRMDGDQKIGEVRGILLHQSVEPLMQEVLDGKLKEFGSEADAYKKKSEDMKRLTGLEQKREKNEEFTRDDLIFLYEIDASIEGFGYGKDPRIEELRLERNLKEDLPMIFDCTPEQIVYPPHEITENTKVYIGPLFNGIFEKNIEHIYTSFPEGKIQRYQTEIGGKTKEQLKAELAEKRIYVSDWANQLMESKDFTVLQSTEQADLVRLTVKDLGFPGGATTDEIYKKAKELGLVLCPAEAGPHLRLSYLGGDWMYIAMKQITDRDGDPSVFNVYRAADGLKLNANGAPSTYGWYSGYPFVFLLRKRNLDTLVLCCYSDTLTL